MPRTCMSPPSKIVGVRKANSETPLAINSLCPKQEKRTTHKPEARQYWLAYPPESTRTLAEVRLGSCVEPGSGVMFVNEARLDCVK